MIVFETNLSSFEVIAYLFLNLFLVLEDLFWPVLVTYSTSTFDD